MSQKISRQMRRLMERKSRKNDKLDELVMQLFDLIANQDQTKSESLFHADQVQDWVPKNQVVEIAGRSINGLVYVGKPPKVKTGYFKNQHCQAYIDPSLPIKIGLGHTSRSKVTAFASYSTLSANDRGNYLNWLATGKSYEYFDPRFIQVYFLGLERRLLIDDPTAQDTIDIVDELDQLLIKFSNLNLLYIEEMRHFYQLVTDVAPYYANATKSNYVLDPLIPKIEGGLKILNNQPLTYQQFYCYLMEIDDENIQSVRQKYPQVFELKFKEEFEKLYPEGCESILPDDVVMYREYQSISGEFSCEGYFRFNGTELPAYLDIFIWQDVIHPLGLQIANELRQTQGMRKAFEETIVSPSYTGYNNTGLSSAYFNHQKNIAKNWKERILKEKSEILVEDVLNFCSYSLPPGEINKALWEKTVSRFAEFGFGLIPDICLFMNYRDFDAPVTLVELETQDQSWAKTPKKYFSVLVSVALGFLIFSKDGSLTKSQKSAIEELIKKTKGLTATEKSRLTHNYQRMLKIPPFEKFISRIGHYKKKIDPKIVRPFLAKCANMENSNTTKTVSLIETVYKRLGIDTALVYSDLHGEELTPDASVNHKKKSSPRELDYNKISKIRSETEKVSEVLGDIFSDQQEALAVNNIDLTSNVLGLDSKHEALVRNLIKRSSWTANEFQNLVKQQGLFPDGALELINEWAFDKFDAPLIDDHEGFHIEADVVEKLMLEFEGEKLAA